MVDRHGARVGVLAAPVLVLLAACAGPPDATPDQVTRWIDDHSTDEELALTLGAGMGPIGPEGPVPTADQGITLEYAEPARLDSVRLRCLGDGTLDFTVRVTRAVRDDVTQTDAVTYEAVPCGTEGEDHPWPAEDVVGVTFGAAGADREGAWQGIALGDG